MSELKPCPFCGSTDVVIVDLADDDGRFAAVGCNDCGAGSRQHYYCGDDAQEFAADAWNRRAEPVHPPAQEAAGAVTREEIEAACRAIRPNLFSNGLRPRPKDGPVTRRVMEEVVSSVECILRAAASARARSILSRLGGAIQEPEEGR